MGERVNKKTRKVAMNYPVMQKLDKAPAMKIICPHKKANQFLRNLIGRQLTNEQLNKRKYFKLYIYRVVCLSTYLCRRKLSVRYELSRQVGVGCESVVRGMNWVTNTRILADYEDHHVNYQLKVSSKILHGRLELVSPTGRLTD